MSEEASTTVRRTVAPKGQPYLLIGLTSQYNWIYDDKGSGSHMDVSLWDPMVNPPYFMVGGYAQGNYSQPSAAIVIVQSVNDPGNTLLAPPIGWNQIWNDQGSGGHNDGSIWYPVAPPDFVSMGFVGQRGYDQPILPNYRCVHKSQVVPATIGNLIWNDQGSGAHDDVSLYGVIGLAGAFVAQGNYQPFSGQAWQFKVP